MKSYTLTSRDVQRIRELRASGTSAIRIASMFGISRQYVYILTEQSHSVAVKGRTVYPGINAYMNEHGIRTVRELGELVLPDMEYQNFLCRMNGKVELSLSDVRAILRATSLPFEKAFSEKPDSRPS